MGSLEQASAHRLGSARGGLAVQPKVPCGPLAAGDVGRRRSSGAGSSSAAVSDITTRTAISGATSNLGGLLVRGGPFGGKSAGRDLCTTAAVRAGDRWTHGLVAVTSVKTDASVLCRCRRRRHGGRVRLVVGADGITSTSGIVFRRARARLKPAPDGLRSMRDSPRSLDGTSCGWVRTGSFRVCRSATELPTVRSTFAGVSARRYGIPGGRAG